MKWSPSGAQNCHFRPNISHICAIFQIARKWNQNPSDWIFRHSTTHCWGPPGHRKHLTGTNNDMNLTTLTKSSHITSNFRFFSNLHQNDFRIIRHKSLDLPECIAEVLVSSGINFRAQNIFFKILTFFVRYWRILSATAAREPQIYFLQSWWD